MAEKVKNVKPPTGWARLLWRAPIWMYKLHLGWLLGGRFLLLNHVGRKSGLPRKAVIEVVKHDPIKNTYYVASGFGFKSDWYQNILRHPEVSIQVGHKKVFVIAVPLSPDESGKTMVDYAQANPKAAQYLMKVIGYEVDGSDDDYFKIGHDYIPFVAFNTLS